MPTNLDKMMVAGFEGFKMKAMALALLMALWASTAGAQAPADKITSEVHKGTFKIAIGLGLVGAGALMYPSRESLRRDNGHDAVPGTMVAGGFGLIAWGAWQRWQAVKPQTTLGVMVGDRRGVQIVHRW